VKTLPSRNAWTLQSVKDATGRRLLTVSRELPLPVSRRPSIRRHKGGTKLAVTFATEELSGFKPAIRVVS